MAANHPLFEVLGITELSNGNLQKFAGQIGIPLLRLKYYAQTNVMPSGCDLERICQFKNISPHYLMLKLGMFDRRLVEFIKHHAEEISSLLTPEVNADPLIEKPQKVFETGYGELYQGDSLALMEDMENDSIDLIFADPPFNLNKQYPSKINDSLKEVEYLEWQEEWMKGCIKILKPGGSLFIWNIPKWNISAADFLNQFLTFRDWIAVDIKYSFPIPNRLYPSHYSLLYFCKGEKPNTFHSDRLPMPVCPNCKHDLRDYGGYKSKMNPKGVNLADVWTDIAPVRHSKYKKRQDANELPVKLLDRVIEMASDEGDVIFDPFGGAGTTYITAEMKKRKWLGCEIGPVDDILDRFSDIERERKYLKKIRNDYNALFTEATLEIRKAKGLWTCESVRNNGKNSNSPDTIKPKQQLLFEIKQTAAST